MPVDDVVADEQWNPQTRLFDSQSLHLVHVFRADNIEQIANRAALDRFGGIPCNRRAGHRLATGSHGQLPQFFGQRHAADQALDTAHLTTPLRTRMNDNGWVTTLERNA